MGRICKSTAAWWSMAASMGRGQAVCESAKVLKGHWSSWVLTMIPSSWYHTVGYIWRFPKMVVPPNHPKSKNFCIETSISIHIPVYVWSSPCIPCWCWWWWLNIHLCVSGVNACCGFSPFVLLCVQTDPCFLLLWKPKSSQMSLPQLNVSIYILLHHITSPYGGWLWLINVRICHWRMDTILIH